MQIHHYFKNYSKPLGRLTILEPAGKDKQGKSLYLCGCYCGNYLKTTHAQLFRLTGAARSCGHCYDSQVYKKEYNCWEGIRDRCSRANSKNYKDYGGRGIKVCQRWNQDFLFFMQDVGFAPSNEHTLERINNDGDYEPNNCKWATRAEQARNTRRSLINRF